MKTLSIEQLHASLARLEDLIREHGELIVTKRGRAIVRIVPIETSAPARRFGTAKGSIHTRTDLDEPLEDFEEYR